MSLTGNRLFFAMVLALGSPVLCLGQGGNGQTDPSKVVPLIDGGIGPCTADFTITDSAGAPLYGAKVKVHIAYGFVGARKLDLEVGTNVDGRARFTGLPDRVKRGFYFHATEGDRSGEAFDDPSNTCKTAFTIQLQKNKQ